MALSANTALTLANEAGATRDNITVATSAVIYNNAIVVRKANGLGAPAANATTTEFVGLAVIDNPDNSIAGLTGASDGSIKVDCISHVDALVPCLTALTAGNMGAAAYAIDDERVTTSNTLGPEVGYFLRLGTATATAWVRFGRKVLAAAS